MQYVIVIIMLCGAVGGFGEYMYHMGYKKKETEDIAEIERVNQLMKEGKDKALSTRYYNL